MSDNLKTPKSRLESNKRYLSKFADVKIRVEPEYRDVIQQHAEAVGESMSAFIKRAIEEAMARDNEKRSGE